MRIALRKMGNSSGVIIPKPFLTEIGARSGDDVDMAVEHGRIIIATLPRHAREGWADASHIVAEAEEKDAAWLDFANEDDKTLAW